MFFERWPQAAENTMLRRAVLNRMHRCQSEMGALLCFLAGEVEPEVFANEAPRDE